MMAAVVPPWCSLLMPPPPPDADLVAQQRCANDAHLLAALLAETRGVLTGGRFASVLASALDVTLRTLCDSMRGPFDGGAQAVPMAKLVPVVAAATDVALLPPPPPSPTSASVTLCPGPSTQSRAPGGLPRDSTTADERLGTGAAQPGGSRHAAGVASAIGTLPCVDALCADLFSAVT